MTDVRRTYTVRDLLLALSGPIGDWQVEVYSGCHDCGGPHLEVDIRDGVVQIIGYPDWMPADEDDE